MRVPTPARACTDSSNTTDQRPPGPTEGLNAAREVNGKTKRGFCFFFSFLKKGNSLNPPNLQANEGGWRRGASSAGRSAAREKAGGWSSLSLPPPIADSLPPPLKREREPEPGPRRRVPRRVAARAPRPAPLARERPGRAPGEPAAPARPPPGPSPRPSTPGPARALTRLPPPHT